MQKVEGEVEIKMIVTDLDGTLLRTDKTMSEYTKNILSQCREAGIKVVYATGRGEGDAGMAPATLFDGRISMNGAIARVNDSIVYERLIPYRTVRQFLVSCDKRGLRITSQVSYMHYSNFNVSDVWPWITNFETVDFLHHNKDAEKIYTFNFTPEDVQFLKDQLPDTLYMVIANDDIAMIMHKDATKGKAVSVLADYWEINQSEIVAFGDDLNDIDLLSFAGVGVAMGNALGKVKSKADYICLDNDNDGVAKWLKENILL